MHGTFRALQLMTLSFYGADVHLMPVYYGLM